MSKELCHTTWNVALAKKPPHTVVKDENAEVQVNFTSFEFPCELEAGHFGNHVAYVRGREMTFPRL
jgi:hypothetical protein